ncbi:MAG: hypothetical protein HRU25_13020 [Psychrobium sp.]|nr:hypothetical protein [Psychrobium sp.]
MTEQIILTKQPSKVGLLFRVLKQTKSNVHISVLPEISCQLNGISVNRPQVAEFNQLCQLTQPDKVTASFVFILAAPAITSIILHPRFPFKALGSIHLSNNITQLSAIAIDEQLNFSVHLTELEQQAKGKAVTFFIEATRQGELVWCCNTKVLFFGGGHGKKNYHSATNNHLKSRETWSLPSNLGRKFAANTGDRNPIHLWAFTAKLFGFKQHIIHGMWSNARIEAALAHLLPPVFKLNLEFKRAITLPNEVIFNYQQSKNGIIFLLSNHCSTETLIIGEAIFNHP